MASLRARLINFALPLMGIKRFFSQPDKLDERIAKMRRQASPRPGKKAHDSFDISEDAARGFDVVTIAPTIVLVPTPNSSAIRRNRLSGPVPSTISRHSE